jgi:hypothetical protein
MKIQEYVFGRVVIDGQTHTKDVIIYPDRVQGNWWRKEGHALFPEDIPDVLRNPPEVLIVGTGAYGRMEIRRETREALNASGVQLIAEPTERACQTFNVLSREKQVVAALHLTC